MQRVVRKCDAVFCDVIGCVVVLHRFQDIGRGTSLLSEFAIGSYRFCIHAPQTRGQHANHVGEVRLGRPQALATLVERLSRLFKPFMPLPSWAPPGTKMLWPFVFVHVCEYSETL